MVIERKLTQKMQTILFHLREIQNQVKLVYSGGKVPLGAGTGV